VQRARTDPDAYARGIDFLAHIIAESARFRDALTAVEPDAPVPTCPDWQADDLLWHLAEVQAFWGAIVDRRLDDPAAVPERERPATRDELFECFDASNDLLVSRLSGTADDVAVWTWAESAQHVGFVRRRQAHEALIHRLDAELTAGAPSELDAELATDGVIEVFEYVFGGAPPWGVLTELGDVGRIVATDTGADWLVRLGRWSGTSPTTGTVYADEGMLDIVDAGSPTFVISGRAGDLDAWLWSRPTLRPVERRGDVSAVEAIIAHGVQ
jgi:uncharacterized protein (TIGR03083 family)